MTVTILNVIFFSLIGTTVFCDHKQFIFFNNFTNVVYVTVEKKNYSKDIYKLSEFDNLINGVVQWELSRNNFFFSNSFHILDDKYQDKNIKFYNS